ncbi:MAG: uracil-DNA glycosylase [Ilumatobacteraceae bacterium]
MKTDWNPVLRGEFAKPYWATLRQFVADERARSVVYPPAAEEFAALHLTPLAETRVVILGQDPYHGPGQAHGLCFSVRRSVALPPSLVNIYKELRTDLGIEPPGHGDLSSWARQGVLLLNTTLTVRAGQAASHQGKGWETFTDEVLARGQRSRPARGVHPVGRCRAQEAGAGRSAAHGDRVGSPVAAVGYQRVLRQQAVQPRQRRPRGRRPGTHRLGGGGVGCGPWERRGPSAAGCSAGGTGTGRWTRPSPCRRTCAITARRRTPHWLPTSGSSRCSH